MTGIAIESPQVNDPQVTPGLGWPRRVADAVRLGWPGVSRETGRPKPLTKLLLAKPPPAPADDQSADPAIEGSPAEPLEVASTTAPPTPAEVARTPAEVVWDAPASPEARHQADPPVDWERAEFRRPAGPRRARFDVDELAAPSTEELDDGSATEVVSRETPSARLPAPARTRVFVVANQKGGVGKTTTAVNLAAGLALGGLSVLLIDLDPQGNASTALGIDHPPGTAGTYDVLIGGRPIASLVQDSPEAAGLTVLPASIDLAGAEIELVSVVARENRLRRAIDGYLEDHRVDYILLDCPPSLGLLTLNALVAATEILIPIQCEYYALEGVSQLLRTINLVKGELNDSLELSTVLLTMFDARTRLAAQVADEVRQHFAAQTLPSVIPRSVRISEAPSYGQTVLTYHPESVGAVSYLEAAREIARRGAKESE
jgi:chromosome partitioning protein